MMHLRWQLQFQLARMQWDSGCDDQEKEVMLRSAFFPFSFSKKKTTEHKKRSPNHFRRILEVNRVYDTVIASSPKWLILNEWSCHPDPSVRDLAKWIKVMLNSRILQLQLLDNVFTRQLAIPGRAPLRPFFP